ncbi:stalk domain-containing protein [Paenibacillus sp. FA6]|uniref:stalk domain-containing protein n=1 Tax=Paenibacillus sp. FA6 TaxID=3413029 RepID=UPI003F65A08F
MNHGISFLLDGEAWTPKDPTGKKLTPISYKGATYVPLKSVAEATGVDVDWDAKKQQISLTTKTSSASNIGGGHLSE